MLTLIGVSFMILFILVVDECKLCDTFWGFIICQILCSLNGLFDLCEFRFSLIRCIQLKYTMAVKTGKCAHVCSVSQDSNLFKLEGNCFTVLSLLCNMNSAISMCVYIYIYISPPLWAFLPLPHNKVIYLNLSFVGSFRMSFNF